MKRINTMFGRRAFRNGVLLFIVLICTFIYLSEPNSFKHVLGLPVEIYLAYKYSATDTIPTVPLRQSKDAYVPKLKKSSIKSFISLPVKTYEDKVVILTPLRDSAYFLIHFTKLLNELSYPHNLISVHFGEEGSRDKTFAVAQQAVEKLVKTYHFRNASVFKIQEAEFKISTTDRHDPNIQLERRAHLARIRNKLLKYGLNDEQWVLWLDIDVVVMQPDVIEQFLFANKDVMAGSCLVDETEDKLYSRLRNYDLNSYRLTIEDDWLYLIWLKDLKGEGRFASLDGVGACVLMIKGYCHRNGLIFPDYIYLSKNTNLNISQIGNTEWNKYAFPFFIESEGLAEMAKDMKFGVYGLPFVEVIHYNTKKRILETLW